MTGAPYASLSDALETLDAFIETLDAALPVALLDVADRGFDTADLTLAEVVNAEGSTRGMVIRRQLSRLLAEGIILGGDFTIEPVVLEQTETVTIRNGAGDVVREIPVGPKARRGPNFTTTPADELPEDYDADELLGMIRRLGLHMGLADVYNTDPNDIVDRAIAAIATDPPPARRRVVDAPQA